jgi:hypothetical protein
VATVSTPVHAFLAAPMAGTAMGQSANLSLRLSVAGFEAVVPIVGVQPNTANISAGWEVYAYRSTDEGATYETVASAGMSIARNPNTSDRTTLRLDTGHWVIRVVSGGNVAATFSFSVGTVDVLTAIANN